MFIICIINLLVLLTSLLATQIVFYNQNHVFRLFRSTLYVAGLIHPYLGGGGLSCERGRRAFSSNIHVGRGCIHHQTRVKSMEIAGKRDFDFKTLFFCCFRYAYVFNSIQFQFNLLFVFSQNLYLCC